MVNRSSAKAAQHLRADRASHRLITTKNASFLTDKDGLNSVDFSQRWDGPQWRG